MPGQDFLDGGLSTADTVLIAHKISLAAVGRAILKEPEAWGARNLCQEGFEWK